MADAIRVSGPVSGTDKVLSFETGKLAQQSQGAVLASLGRTTVLAPANAAKDVRPGTDFFPLTIDVEERAYAAGKVPGSFFRREGRPTEDAILTCRLTDRPLRPAFPEGFRNETQVVLTVMGADMATDILQAWLETDFAAGRHARRVEKIADIEVRHAGDRAGGRA